MKTPKEIKLGKSYRAKETMKAPGQEPRYIKGHIYKCEIENNGHYGFITDEQGEKYHPWPLADIGLVCNDNWEDYFDEI